MSENEKIIGFDCSAILNKKQLKVWVPYNDQLKVQINHLDRQQFSDLVDQATKIIHSEGQLKPQFDNILFGELLCDAAIADWSGAIADGAPIPCTSVNKRTFGCRWMAFAKFISGVCTDLDRLITLEREAVRKNSEGSSGQEQIIQE